MHKYTVIFSQKCVNNISVDSPLSEEAMSVLPASSKDAETLVDGFCRFKDNF